MLKKKRKEHYNLTLESKLSIHNVFTDRLKKHVLWPLWANYPQIEDVYVKNKWSQKIKTISAHHLNELVTARSNKRILKEVLFPGFGWAINR